MCAKAETSRFSLAPQAGHAGTVAVSTRGDRNVKIVWHGSQ
jgi:hypothetical protein